MRSGDALYRGLGKFCNVLESFCTVLESFGKFLHGFGKFWKVSESFGKLFSDIAGIVSHGFAGS
jgi:hypothetical protein